jgi:hypothetical protein
MQSKPLYSIPQKIHFHIICRPMSCFSSGLFLSEFPTNYPYECNLLPIRPTWPDCSNLLREEVNAFTCSSATCTELRFQHWDYTRRVMVLNFKKSEILWKSSQNIVNGFYSEPDEPNPQPPFLFLLHAFLMLFFALFSTFPIVSLTSQWSRIFCY